MTAASLLTVLAPHVQSVDARAALVLVALLVSLAAGWLGYRLIEAPSIRWAKRFGYRAGSNAPARGPAPRTIVASPVEALVS